MSADETNYIHIGGLSADYADRLRCHSERRAAGPSEESLLNRKGAKRAKKKKKPWITNETNWTNYANKTRASAYDGTHLITNDYSSYRHTFDYFNSTIKPWLPPHALETCLEIGSGTGLYTLPLIKSGIFARFIYSDIHLDILEQIRKKFEKFSIDDSNAYPLVFDAGSLPIAHGKVDLLLSVGVLHHVAKYEELIQKSYSILKENGVACFLEPTQGYDLFEYILELSLLYNSKNSRYNRLKRKLSKLTSSGYSDSLHPEDMQRIHKLRDDYRFLRENRGKPEMIEKLIDKWVFDSDQLRELLKSTGFSRVETLPAYNMSWCSHVQGELRWSRVSQEGLDLIARIVKPLDEISAGRLWKQYSPTTLFIAFR